MMMMMMMKRSEVSSPQLSPVRRPLQQLGHEAKSLRWKCSRAPGRTSAPLVREQGSRRNILNVYNNLNAGGTASFGLERHAAVGRSDIEDRFSREVIREIERVHQPVHRADAGCLDFGTEVELLMPNEIRRRTSPRLSAAYPAGPHLARPA